MAASIDLPPGLQDWRKRAPPLGDIIRLIYMNGFSFSGFERDKLFLNRGTGSFVDASSVSGCDSPLDGRGAVIADFDNDGAVDIFVHNAFWKPNQLYRNVGGRSGSWVRLILEGRKSNRDAVGAVVRARLPADPSSKRPVPRVLVRTVECGHGYASSSDKRVLLGLGQAGHVEDVQVRWPAGTTVALGRLEAGRSYRLIEGELAAVEVKLPRFELGSGGPHPSEATGLTTQALPRFELATLSGESLDSSKLLRSWTLVNFWSPSCVPCLGEMPRLEALSKRYRGRLNVVGIALVRAEQKAAAGAAVSRLGVSYPVALTPQDLPERLFGRASIDIPTSLLIEPSGRIAAVYRGADRLADLEAEVDRRLGARR